MTAYPPSRRYLTPPEFSDSKNSLKSGKRFTLAIAVIELAKPLESPQSCRRRLRQPKGLVPGIGGGHGRALDGGTRAAFSSRFSLGPARSFSHWRTIV